MKKLIVVSDWANDSLAVQEFRSAVEGFLKNGSQSRINFVSSTPSTIHTGFLLNQIALTEEQYGDPMETVLFQNTDSRIQANETSSEAKGAGFIIIRLRSGIFLCGPNAGFDFSFVRSNIEKIYRYPGLDMGSQFRSRDLYSRVSAHLMDEMEDELDLEEEHVNIVPGVMDYYVGHIDNFGNIKTTITQQDLKGKYEYGNMVSVLLNGITKKLKYVDNLFGGITGELVFYPGSSGKKDNRFMEISVWRHFTEDKPTTGLHEFNHPRPGQKIVIK